MPTKPDQSGVFRLLKEDTSAQPTFVLPAGSYIVHVAFGLASTAKPVQVSREVTRETFEIAGGGLRVEGRVGNVKIPIGQISFDIYQGSQFEQSDRRPIRLERADRLGRAGARGHLLHPVQIRRRQRGGALRHPRRCRQAYRYHGDAPRRADHVQACQQARRRSARQHRLGGASARRDTIAETKGVPRVILAEGEYKIIARNDNKVFTSRT